MHAREPLVKPKDSNVHGGAYKCAAGDAAKIAGCKWRSHILWSVSGLLKTSRMQLTPDE